MYLIITTDPITGHVVRVRRHLTDSTPWTTFEQIMQAETEYRRITVWDLRKNIALGGYRVNIPPAPPVDLDKATKWVEEKIISDVNMKIGMIDMIKLVREAFPGLGLVQARDVVRPLYTL